MFNARSVVHILDIIVGETGVGQVVTHTQSGGQNYYRTSIFTCKKNGFKSVISILCRSVSVRNIIHFAIDCNNPVRFLSDNSQCSAQRSDLIIISLSGMTRRHRTN